MAFLLWKLTKIILFLKLKFSHSWGGIYHVNYVGYVNIVLAHTKYWGLHHFQLENKAKQVEIKKGDYKKKKKQSVPFSWLLSVLTHYSYYIYRTIKKARKIIIRKPHGHSCNHSLNTGNVIITIITPEARESEVYIYLQKRWLILPSNKELISIF